MKRHQKSVFRSLAMVTQLGLCVVTPVFLCVFAGYYLDSRYGTGLTLPLLILGVLAGGRCGYGMARQTFLVNEKEEAREDQEREAERRAREAGTPPASRPKTPSRVRREAPSQADKED